MDIVNPCKSLMERIREEASRRIVKKGNYRGIQGFMDDLVHESLVVWLEAFPEICRDLIRVNRAKTALLQQIGNKGKYTDTYGWSENRTFKFEYEYTPEFYYFMTNYVYHDFFGNDNKKHYRQFMKRLFRGDDPIETLMWVKKIYGNNQQKENVVNV